MRPPTVLDRNTDFLSSCFRSTASESSGEGSQCGISVTFWRFKARHDLWKVVLDKSAERWLRVKLFFAHGACLSLREAKGTVSCLEIVILYLVSCWNRSSLICTLQGQIFPPAGTVFGFWQWSYCQKTFYSSIHFVTITSSQVIGFPQPSRTNHVPCKGKVATLPNEKPQVQVVANSWGVLGSPLSCCYMPTAPLREPHQKAGHRRKPGV